MRTVRSGESPRAFLSFGDGIGLAVVERLGVGKAHTRIVNTDADKPRQPDNFELGRPVWREAQASVDWTACGRVQGISRHAGQHCQRIAYHRGTRVLTAAHS